MRSYQDAERGKVVVFDLANANPQPVEVAALRIALSPDAATNAGKIAAMIRRTARTRPRGGFKQRHN